MEMSRVAALGAGFAMMVALVAFSGFAVAQAPAASAQPPTAPAKAAPPAAAKAPASSDALNMVPPAGPGVFAMQKKGANGLHLSVTGHKFTSRAEIENYLAWRAAEETRAQKG